MASNIIDLRGLTGARVKAKRSPLKENAVMGAVMIGLVAALVAWELRSGPEYPAMSNRLEQTIGADLRKAGISKWKFSYCRPTRVDGTRGSYSLNWTEGDEDCGAFSDASWRFTVALGKDGKYHFFSPDVGAKQDDFDGTAKGTIERARDMLAAYQQARTKQATDEASREHSTAQWNAKG